MISRFRAHLTVFLLLLTALLLSDAALAQDRGAQRRGGRGLGGTINGLVVDNATDEPIPSATVELRSAADSSLVTGAITTGEGVFQIERIRPGSYYVRVSFVGFAPTFVSDVTISTQNPTADVGTVALREDTAQLEEVQVSAEREYMEVGIDRNVYNVRNQPVTAGGSARDVLENIPSVEVDIDGNISLRGSQGVAIYLNGKPAPMRGEALTSFLEGLSSDDIERVEVIPNPSARYDPEGMSGIINIVLATEKELGWGGGVSASAGTRQNYNGSANAHYGSGPWNVYANYSLRYGEHERSGERFLENRFLNPRTYLDQQMDGQGGGFSNTFNASADYELSDKNTLSFSTVFSHRNNDGDELTSYSEMDADRSLTQRYNRLTDGARTDLSMDYRLGFRRVITPREHEFTASARYEEDDEEDASSYRQRVLPLESPGADGELADWQETDENEHQRSASLQADYRRPLGENAHLEAGYKSDLEWLNSTFYSESLNGTETLVPDVNLNNTFDYAEQIHAAYGIVGGQLGDFGAQLGLRAERALTTFDQRTLGETFDNSYFSLFPSMHASYEPFDGNTFKLSYSKRVRRPRTRQLNPFGDYDDPTFIRVGNPYLTPEYTHSFEMGYSRLGRMYTISFSPYYRHTVNAISRHEQTDPSGVSTLTYENFATEDSYGAELIGSLTLGRWLRGNASVNAYKQVTDASNLASELSNDAIGFRTRGSLMAELGRGVTLQVSQFYRSPMGVPGGHVSAFTMTNVALKKDLLSGRASLSLRASDVFDTMGLRVERDLERYYQEINRDFNRQGLQFTFRYNFGRQERNQQRGQSGDRGGQVEEGGGMEGL